MLYIVAQTADTTLSVPTKLSEYGPFGALVGVLIVLAAICAFLWSKVVQPHLNASAQIAAKHAETTQALKDTAQTFERTAIFQKESQELIGAHTERLGVLIDKLHEKVT